MSRRRPRFAFGTGFTAQLCLGQPPIPIGALRTYVEQVKGLLGGDTVDIEGRRCRMMDVESITVPRPIAAEIWLSVFGPKGRALAQEIADGIIGSPLEGLPAAAMSHGTVLDPGESRGSERAIEATAPYLVFDWHAADGVGPDAVDALPGGETWRRSIDDEVAARPGERHLIVHEGHVTHVNGHDRRLLLPHLPLPSQRSLTGHAEEVAAKLAVMADKGWAEVIYTPTGPDLAREMRAMRAATSG